MTTVSARRLLLVHAHPDDETIGTGAVMARHAAEGVHVTLVTCTLGEEGEILLPPCEPLAADRADLLGTYRIGELARACAALGVRDHRFLGGPGRYRDSGMMGTPANDRPECFWRVDVDQAAGLLAAVVREVRPQVVVTYDENGGYGHPDHIQAHRVTMRAVELAAGDPPGPDAGGPPWEVAKGYWTAMPASYLQRGLDAMRALGEASPFAGVQDAADLPFAVPDEVVTTAVDAEAYVDRKLAALRAHATQVAVDGPLFALSNNLGYQVLGTEFFTLVRGVRGPGSGEHGWEDDLFAGIGDSD